MSSFIDKKIIYIIIGLVAFLLLTWLFSNILLYFVISLIIATLLRPLTEFLNQTQVFSIKLPRFVAVIISFAVLINVFSLFIILFIPLISDQIQVLSSLNYTDLLLKATRPLESFELFLIQNNITLEEPGFIVENLRLNISQLLNRVNIGLIFNNLISFTGSFFIAVMAVLFISFFLLYERGIIRKQFISLIPNQYFELTIAGIYKIEKLLTNYLLGLIFQMLAIFSLASLGLTIFHVNYALTIAIFAAVANLIPYAGPILGATFGIVVGISTGGFDLETREYYILVLKIVAVFGSVQMIDNLFLQPLIFSKSVKAHPLEIFVIIFVGATLAGIVGMIAAIPVYTIIRVSAFELYRGYKAYYIFKT